jgi:type III secretory pathway component EscU
MFDYKRGIKVGFLSHIIVYIIFGIWTTFLSIPYISSISYYTSNINMGQIAFMLYIYGIFWGAIYGVIIGVLFARFYEKIQG